MTRNIMTVQGIRKAYSGRPILAGIDLAVEEGTTTAVLGPNGAGKTTLVRILSTLTRPDAGDATIAGFDLRRQPAEVRRVISLTGQYAAVDELLTARENMRLMCRLRHVPPREGTRFTNELMERFDLVDSIDRPVKSFSGGMKRKLDLAMSLVGSPRLIFLDEPTTGLDPRSRTALWEVIRELTTSGVSIVLTTQYLEEADQLASRISLIDGGRTVAEGTPQALKRQVGGEVLELTFRDPALLARARVLLTSAQAADDESSLRIGIDGSARAVSRVLGALEGAGVDAERVALHAPTLDDVFFQLTDAGASSMRQEAA
ncbi:MAG: ATP-binding cassette domain-containing protein [Thermomicrobiales bacterium]